MRDFSRQANPQFVAFKQFAECALEQHPGLTRLDCLNPIKAVRHEFDFSQIPEIDLLTTWQRFLTVRFETAVFSQGVRDSLYDIFSCLHREGAALTLPAGVYPVYEMIARAVGLSVRLSPGLASFDLGEVETEALLVTAPTVPQGRDLSVDDVARLATWLSQSSRRRLILDRVYDYDNSPVIQPLIDGGRTLVCYSLSKTFLSPLLLGMVIVPPEWKPLLDKPLPPDAWRAKVLLTRYRTFPARQQEIFRYRWRQLQQRCGIVPPQTGYLAVVARDSRQLLEQEQALVIPGEVYGADPAISIVSCLHETNALDENEEVDRFHVTVLSNFARGYDKYSRRYSKAGIPESTFPDRFFLLERDHLEAGFAKARRLLEKTAPGDRLLVLRTRVRNCELSPNERTGIGAFVRRNEIEIDGLLNEGLRELTAEEAMAGSLALLPLRPWASVRPRSLSVLPIATACQAQCRFCFSHSSVSGEQPQGRIAPDQFELACARAAQAGAERLVITGGGEPTLLAHARLLDLMRTGSRYFRKIVLISNGLRLGTASDEDRAATLRDYAAAGLTTLAISRHSSDRNAEIMQVETNSERIAQTLSGGDIGLEMRWICVLQRAGVHDERSLSGYLDWVRETGVREVCFKELYVAATAESVYHDREANAWCRANQVPMSVVQNFLEDRAARRIGALPWGAPIYELSWKGTSLRIAVYTEPSVFWERSNGLCRSWNLMADGTCYASLETTDSRIDFATAVDSQAEPSRAGA